MVELNEIHWRDSLKLGGAPFQQSPHPWMLNEGGHRMLRSYKPTGKRPGAIITTQYVYVLYDKAYIEAWLYHNFVKKLPGMTHVEARALLVGAMKMRNAN
jgi:hypothetical protein